MTTKQTELWEGVFGDAYQERNELTQEEIKRRQGLMRTVLTGIYSRTGKLPTDILEIGAGQGPNLCGLEKLSIELGVPIGLYATEINQKARIALSENCTLVKILDDIPSTPTFDLVYTYGVMIHTHPAHLRSLQQKIYDASKRFIACFEYFAPETRPIMYRGEKDALWLDDYGKKFMDNFPLNLVTYGFAWKPFTGLDNVTYWVLEKKDKMI